MDMRFRFSDSKKNKTYENRVTLELFSLLLDFYKLPNSEIMYYYNIPYYIEKNESGKVPLCGGLKTIFERGLIKNKINIKTLSCTDTLRDSISMIFNNKGIWDTCDVKLLDKDILIIRPKGKIKK